MNIPGDERHARQENAIYPVMKFQAIVGIIVFIIWLLIFPFVLTAIDSAHAFVDGAYPDYDQEIPRKVRMWVQYQYESLRGLEHASDSYPWKREFIPESQLLEAYLKDKNAADKRYRQKQILITGQIIKTVKNPIFDVSEYVLVDDGHVRLTASFSNDESGEFEKAKRGDTVWLECTIGGFLTSSESSQRVGGIARTSYLDAARCRHMIPRD